VAIEARTVLRAPVALAATGALVLAISLLSWKGGLLSEGGDGSEEFKQWKDGSEHGSWRSVFNGHGVNGERNGVISMRPMPAKVPEETHAGLVVSRTSYADLDLSAQMRTVTQLRQPTPNQWEVPWLVWAYTDDFHFYYLTLKPNGWELGKRDPAYPGGQRFLATGKPGFPVGKWYDVRVSQRGATITAYAGSLKLTEHTDGERPYTQGAIGLYTEDAEVEFKGVRINGK
jgi:hypothetical protein